MGTRWAMGCLVLAACHFNESGHQGATKLGDTSHPAERRSPIAEVREACGDTIEGSRSAQSILREPYLQLTTESTATIGWVTSIPIEARVEVAPVLGTPLTHTSALIDAAAWRTGDERQVWASLEGLSPDTIYCYQLADDDGLLSAKTGFRTAPSADSNRPIRFMAFGDSGGGNADQLALLAQMYTVPFELMVHTGDIAYDDGTIAEFERTVFAVYSELLRNIPFFPSAGNHEYRTMQGAPFREVFALPGGGGEKWYSYDWGRIHFIALDTEADLATQAAWMDADLAATTRPWKIVYFHKPPYSSGSHGSDSSVRRHFAPVFEKHHVQLVLSGHDHNYERMIPQNGVTYVVTGGGGIGTRGVDTSSFTAFSEDVIHFVYVEVNVDDLVLHAIDATGVEFDSVVVPK